MLYLITNLLRLNRLCKIIIKAKWDTTHHWNITERPLNRQKPGAITKQKADKEKKRVNKNAQRREEMNNR